MAKNGKFIAYTYMKYTDDTLPLSGEALLDRLRATDWKRIIQQLHYYSLNRLKHFPALAEKYDLKNLANQFADDAIRQVWMEERKWNLTEYPELYDFLKGAVDSLRYNFIKKRNNDNHLYR